MSEAQCTQPPRAVLRAEALEDLEAVERILLRGWAGLEVSSELGIDVDALFSLLRADIEQAVEPIDPKGFKDLLARRLAQLNDNHMAVFGYSTTGYSNYRSMGGHDDAYVAEFVLHQRDDGWKIGSGAYRGSYVMSCSGYPLSEIMRPSIDADLKPVHRLIVLSRTQLAEIRCMLRTKTGAQHTVQIPLRSLRAAPSERKGQPVFERLPSKVPWLRIRGFDTRDAGSLRKFVDSAQELRDAKTIVLDIRGNRGGDDTWVRDWFKQLSNAQFQYSTIETLQSEVTLQGDQNDALCHLAAGGDEAGLMELKNRLSLARENLTAAKRKVGRPFREWIQFTPVDQGLAPAPFDGQLIVLIDRFCASSCEQLISYAVQLPRTIVVGENSAGVGTFGDVRSYRLPRSGLGFAASKKWFHSEIPNAVSPEGRGFLPNLWLDAVDTPNLVEKLVLSM